VSLASLVTLAEQLLTFNEMKTEQKVSALASLLVAIYSPIETCNGFPCGLIDLVLGSEGRGRDREGAAVGSARIFACPTYPEKPPGARNSARSQGYRLTS
jgi:hypothetical protein